jgi:hypothetical protein
VKDERGRFLTVVANQLAMRCGLHRAYLLHAIEAIDAILSYTVDGREAFFSDGKIQDAVIRNIEIIDQAGSRWAKRGGSGTATARRASTWCR